MSCPWYLKFCSSIHNCVVSELKGIPPPPPPDRIVNQMHTISHAHMLIDSFIEAPVTFKDEKCYR